MQLEPFTDVFEPRTTAELTAHYDRTHKGLMGKARPSRRNQPGDGEVYWREEAARLKRQVCHLENDIQKRDEKIASLTIAIHLRAVATDAAKMAARPCRALVVAEVARHFNISIEALAGPGRTRGGKGEKDLVWPRVIACWIMHARLGYSLAETGRAINRDHSTVLHALKKITEANADTAAIEQSLGM